MFELDDERNMQRELPLGAPGEITVLFERAGELGFLAAQATVRVGIAPRCGDVSQLATV